MSLNRIIARHIIDHVRRCRVTIWAHNGRVRFGNQGHLPHDLRAAVMRHEADILPLLEAEQEAEQAARKGEAVNHRPGSAYLQWLAHELIRRGVRPKGDLWIVPPNLDPDLGIAMSLYWDDLLPLLRVESKADYMRVMTRVERPEQAEDRLSVEWLIASTRERP